MIHSFLYYNDEHRMPVLDRTKFENMTTYRDLVFSIRRVQNAGLWKGCWNEKKDGKITTECKMLGKGFIYLLVGKMKAQTKCFNR